MDGMTRNAALALALTLASACASNPYAKFYQPAPDLVLRSVSQRRVQPPPVTPELIRGNNPKDDVAALEAEGYVVIGHSNFNGPKLDADDAVEQGKKVGADRVLTYGRLTSTEHTAVPLTLPTVQTSVTNGTATAYSPYGTATAYGSATTTTYGTETTYIPLTVRRYDGLAIYFVKEKYSFGALFRGLSPEETKSVGTVNGVTLTVVVRGSPAAAAGFLPSDVATKADGAPVIDPRQFTDFLVTRQGQTVTLTVSRGGMTTAVPVLLDTY